MPRFLPSSQTKRLQNLSFPILQPIERMSPTSSPLGSAVSSPLRSAILMIRIGAPGNRSLSGTLVPQLRLALLRLSHIQATKYFVKSILNNHNGGRERRPAARTRARSSSIFRLNVLAGSLSQGFGQRPEWRCANTPALRKRLYTLGTPQR